MKVPSRPKCDLRNTVAPTPKIPPEPIGKLKIAPGHRQKYDADAAIVTRNNPIVRSIGWPMGFLERLMTRKDTDDISITNIPGPM
jgi:hypothetical protein